MENFKKLGECLTKAQQKAINGGAKQCDANNDCRPGECCKFTGDINNPPSTGYCGIPNSGEGWCFPPENF